MIHYISIYVVFRFCTYNVTNITCLSLNVTVMREKEYENILYAGQLKFKD